MNRREAIRRVSLLMGGAISAPTLAGLLGGCQAGPSGPSATTQTLSSEQFNLVSTLAEHILPKTDTPGAIEAGVPEFIDAMLSDWFPAADRDRFLAGLADVDARAQTAYGSGFVATTVEQQIELMTQLDAEAFPQGETAPRGEPAFFATMKELTLSGYYTSEVGATQELRVNPMGVYLGDIPYADIGRAWA